MVTDRQRIEDAIIPAVFVSLIYSHIIGAPHVEESYEEALPAVKSEILRCIGTDNRLKRRLDRITLKISKYFVDNQFCTRKAFLTVFGWLTALMDADAITIQEEAYFKVLMDMKEIIITGYEEIPDFEKIDCSALNHVTKLHKIAQEEGYYL